MALEERKCPNCGSTHLVQKDDLIICQNCEATYKDSNHFKVTNVHIIRDEAKLAKIKAKEREEAQDKKIVKIALFVMAGLILLCLVIALATGQFKPTIYAPADSSLDYRYVETEQVVRAFKDAGFEDIETLPVYDVKNKSLEWINRVSKVTIGGDEQWVSGVVIKSKKSYKKDAPVKIYYRLLGPETKIYAPEWDTGNYKGQKYQTVQKALADACFNNIKLIPLQDLDAIDDENNEKVEKVTINGETDWSTSGILGGKNEYEQNSEVIIYYHSVKQ